MSSTLNAQKLLGYTVAGGLLVLAGQFVPDIALATTGLIFLAVLLTHAGQLTQLSSWITSATKGNTITEGGANK